MKGKNIKQIQFKDAKKVIPFVENTMIAIYHELAERIDLKKEIQYAIVTPNKAYDYYLQ